MRKKNLVIYSKLNHSDAFVTHEVLVNYLEKKIKAHLPMMILRNLRCKIRRRLIDEKNNFNISYFTAQ